jgi:general L-amino acid transport system substrate-binding protein
MRIVRSFDCLLLAAVGFAAPTLSAAAAATLDDVKARGELVCGVSQGISGFSAEEGGAWLGFDVDFCRAVAAAIFADPQKVQFVPLSASERFDALRTGKIDLLSRNSTWTMGREAEFGISFAAVTYYDGQGLLVPRARNVTSALELAGSKVCVQSGTTSESNVGDFFATNSMAYEAVQTANPTESIDGYKSGRCNAVTSDVSQLYSERLKLPDAAEHVILPDVISKEPLGPAVRLDDPNWRLLVQWVHFAMLDAEELGVNSGNVEEALASKKPDVMRLVGSEGAFGEQLGLSKDWAVNIVRLVGNYGEVYERNLGTSSRLGIPRGMNQLWNRGGIQYAPPIR